VPTVNCIPPEDTLADPLDPPDDDDEDAAEEPDVSGAQPKPTSTIPKPIHPRMAALHKNV